MYVCCKTQAVFLWVSDVAPRLQVKSYVKPRTVTSNVFFLSYVVLEITSVTFSLPSLGHSSHDQKNRISTTNCDWGLQKKSHPKLMKKSLGWLWCIGVPEKLCHCPRSKLLCIWWTIMFTLTTGTVRSRVTVFTRTHVRANTRSLISSTAIIAAYCYNNYVQEIRNYYHYDKL